MNAEQYRALVQKLEAITEAPLELPPGAEPEAGMTVATADDNSGAAPVAAPAAQPVATQPANTIPTIDAATFSQAYAQAVKQKLKQFKWCGTYAVKAKPVMTQPKPPVKPKPPLSRYEVPKQDYTVTNPMGDFDPTAFNGQAAARR